MIPFRLVLCASYHKNRFSHPKGKKGNETEIPHLPTPNSLGVEEETSHGESLYTWTNEKELLLYMTTAIKYLKMSKSPIKKEKFLLNNNNNPSQENLQLLRTQYSNVSR